jgi:drug/metabolite transporter (DMT)-like permease
LSKIVERASLFLSFSHDLPFPRRLSPLLTTRPTRDVSFDTQLLGDALVLLAGVLYACSNTGQEKQVQQSKLEYLALLGVFGAPISLMQVSTFSVRNRPPHMLLLRASGPFTVGHSGAHCVDADGVVRANVGPLVWLCC